MSSSSSTSADTSSSYIASTSLITQSAVGTTSLILLQMGSRALTFGVNQLLLRYLSPELLGLAAQLELLAISVLYFARDSVRVALQRRGGSDLGVGSSSLRAPQAAVNVSYIAVVLGPVLAFGLARAYEARAASMAAEEAEQGRSGTSGVALAVRVYALAAVLELLAEPCFVVVQQEMLYGIRAAAEGLATVVRCVVTAAVAIWASGAGLDLGVLPFAMGQMAYAVVLNLVYHAALWRRNLGLSLWPKRLPDGQVLIFLCFWRNLLTMIGPSMSGRCFHARF